MKHSTLLILFFVLPFLFTGCASKQQFLIQANELIEDNEFLGMYGPEYADGLPETGIVINNKSDKDITVTLTGAFSERMFVLSGSTSHSALPPGNYNYTIFVEEDRQREPQQSRFSSKELIISLTGKTTIRKSCRNTFNVSIIKKTGE